MSSLILGVVGDSFHTGYPSNTPAATLVTGYYTSLGYTTSVSNQAANGTTSGDWAVGGGSWTAARALFVTAGITDLWYNLGINDCQVPYQISGAAYQSNVTGVIDSIRTALPNVRVWLIGPGYPTPGYGPYWDSTGPAKAREYRATHPTIAGLYSGVYVIGQSIYETLRDNSAYKSDTLHPSTTGNAWMAQSLFDAMRCVDTLSTRTPSGKVVIHGMYQRHQVTGGYGTAPATSATKRWFPGLSRRRR